MDKIDVYKNRKRDDPVKVKDILRCIISGFICACIILTILRVSIVSGPSMENTLHDGQRLIVSKIVYLIKSPEKGDIVIAKTKKLNVEYIIKRVIGTPGDTIELKNNEFYVNGEKIDEPYIKEKMINTENQTWILDEDEYFICGDNRNNSTDSRIIGPLNKSEIYGKVIFDISHFKFIK